MNACFAAERYGVTPLPFIPFSNSGGEALNHNGVVAGGIANSDGSVSLAKWSEGALTNLGVPPGFPSPEFSIPRVFGINDYAAVVGTIHTPGGDLPSRSFIYDRNRFTVLPLAHPGNLGGAAIGINNQGDVVGYDHTSNNRLAGWLWSKGVYSSLPVSGTSTVALGINPGGIIIGNRRLSYMRRLLTGQLRRTGERGFVLGGDATQHLAGFVCAINELGEAAGGSVSDGQVTVTIYKNGIATVIPGLRGFAVGINSSATVVGSFQPAGENRRHLFKWSAEWGAFDITPAGYRSAEAAAINNRGDILGFGETQGGVSGYFLITPDSNGALMPIALTTGPPGATVSGNESIAAR